MSVTRPILYCLVVVVGVLPPHAVASTINAATTPRNLYGLCPILDAPFITKSPAASQARIARSGGLYTRFMGRSGGASARTGRTARWDDCGDEPARGDRPQARRRRAHAGGDRVPARRLPQRRHPRLPDGRVVDGGLHSRD